MSMPAQNAVPAPLRTRTRVSSSLDSSSRACTISSCSNGFIALRFSGRFRYSHVMPSPFFSILIVSYVCVASIACLPSGGRSWSAPISWIQSQQADTLALSESQQFVERLLAAQTALLDAPERKTREVLAEAVHPHVARLELRYHSPYRR